MNLISALKSLRLNCTYLIVLTRNCLFRALGDQLDGHGRNHLKHRGETVRYILDHRGDFEPFVEDDVPFDKHSKNCILFEMIQRVNIWFSST